MIAYFVNIFSAFDVIGNILSWLQESATDQILSHMNWFSEWQIISPKLYTRVIIAHTCSCKNRSFYEYLSSLIFWRRKYFLNFSTSCIKNVNNTGTKYVRIMKQTAFWREKTESIYHV